MPSPALGVHSLPFGFHGAVIFLRNSVLLTSLSLILVTLGVIGYRLLFHPLARVPGPRLAAISNVWYACQVRNGRMLRLGKSLHKRYGPAVRVGPNEVWFDSVDAFKHIYLSTALQRPDITYTPLPTFTSPDTLDLLSERNTQRYRLQRRLVGPLYQTSYLKRHEPALDAVLGRVIATLRSLDGAEIDLKEWMHIIAVESLSAVVLTWSPNYLRDKTDHSSSSHGYMGWRRKSIFGLFPLAVKLELLSKTFGRTFANLWRVTYKTPKNFKPFFTGVYRQVSRRVTSALAGKPISKNDRKDDFLTDLIQLHKDKPDFSETYLRRMAITNFGAGHETMCSALTSIMAMIGSHPEVQRRAANEVRSATEDPKVYDHAVRLSYTQAAIKEAQRLYPVLGMALPRTVPPEGFAVGGQMFPPGTTVGCNPVSLHRNTAIFGEDAEGYNPERWLDADRNLKSMERFNLTWGGGGRMCPGRHLAELVVYKTIPALLEHFDVEVVMPRRKKYTITLWPCLRV
ncbi:cytochrome P450 monooxygenase sdnT [Colletotrichum spaethianum]|uniref:Cytochrome P450 monooxygenase sdnT n=1 Tax=Colletotrichum spaethianum TaxID=700344 RepID=A0AA37L3H0_9PEZI|nr:cytochrome P450 monooxygenase sdnT [Colletotrichum spaethianum]GKT41263.1 cytochrome P450 monooxygenase sdnT [Colletotrichum spaethianum]